MADAAYMVDAGIALIVNNILTDSVYKYVSWGVGAAGAAGAMLGPGAGVGSGSTGVAAAASSSAM